MTIKIMDSVNKTDVIPSPDCSNCLSAHYLCLGCGGFAAAQTKDNSECGKPEKAPENNEL